ncbi:MAG: acyltransferase [Candidatus Nanoarchaeia archaeon]
MEEKNEFKRMIVCFKFPEGGLSIRKWRKIRHPLRVLLNYIVITLCKFLPDIKLKYKLYSSIGIKIGKNTRIFGTNFDIFFPELIEIGDNCTLGAYTTIMTHEFLNGHYRKGKVKIGNGVLMGTLTLVLPGVKIGDGAKIAAYSLVNKNVKPFSFVGGVPIKEIGS